MKKYLGISGITTAEEINAIRVIWGMEYTEQYNLYLGFLLNSNQIMNKSKSSNIRNIDLENYHALMGFYEKGIEKIFHIYFRENSQIYEKIDYLISNYYSDEYPFDGFQFNMESSNNREIEEIRKEWNFTMILQLNQAILKEIDKIDVSLFDYVLIDLSRGKGIKCDLAQYDSIVKRLKEKSKNISIGIAGGITPYTIKKYAHNYSEYSFDAESRIRKSDNSKIDPKLVLQYIKNAKN